ncbi:hypothetical protein LCGC14_0873670 [marine sediment metagenome]|uniref:Uncharacterized protein n=1 Tax=marine sediment metagenome TaxID=412755 RepID=A0A0F9P3Y0_9ZZZZ
MSDQPTSAERYRRAHIELCHACVGDKRVNRVTSRKNGSHISTDILPCSTCNGRGYLITAIDPLDEQDSDDHAAKDLQVHVRTLERRNRKLQERLNRISNAMVGNQRIWELDRLAMECEVEADLAIAEYNLDEDIPHVSVDARLAIEREAQCRADALFLRRLEWDLGELHVAVRGDTNRRGGRYDQAEWKGQRP